MVYATAVKDSFDLSFPDCSAVDVETWTRAWGASSRREPGAAAKAKSRDYRTFHCLLSYWKILLTRPRNEEFTYLKIYRYLALASVENGLTEQVVKEKNQESLACKTEETPVRCLLTCF